MATTPAAHVRAIPYAGPSARTTANAHGAPGAPPGTAKARPEAKRIDALDVVRGFALVGILVMNVQAFSMPIAAYFNPTAYGDLSGVNGWVWAIGHLFFDLKFITLFSMLFGAGILLMASRAEGPPSTARRRHVRRMAWLLVFGLAHAFLLWFGDILVLYAISGLVVFAMRNLRPRTKLIVAASLLAVPLVLFALVGATLPGWPEADRAEMREVWSPGPETVAHEVDAYRGGWLDQMEHRVPETLTIYTMYFPLFLLWRTVGIMLLGMAVLQWGILSGERSASFYGRLSALGYAIGLPIVAAGIAYNNAVDWSYVESQFFGYLFNYVGSVGIALGHLGAVLWVWKRGVLPRLQASFRAVGRTAFSNYILQTLICVTLFYGTGFGLFGSVPRWGQALVWASIVVTQLVVSPLYLRRFAMGPLEWLWRTLTYGRLQPFRHVGATAT